MITWDYYNGIGCEEDLSFMVACGNGKRHLAVLVE